LFSSKSDEWETPQWLFDELNEEFGFTLDPCATHENHKCNRYFTKEEDGLSRSWHFEIVFMNPPYGRSIGKWIKKAYEEYQKGAIVVCLVPARTDTRWWHDYCMKGTIRFIKGRLKFWNRTLPSYGNGGEPSSAPFPSAIVIFNNKYNCKKGKTICESYDKV